EKFLKGEMRVDAGGNNVGGKFFAFLKGNTAGAAILNEDFANGRFGADFDASFARGVGNGVRNCARSAAAETPGAEGAIDFPHVMVQENVGGARRTNAEEGADEAGGRHR